MGLFSQLQEDARNRRFLSRREKMAAAAVTLPLASTGLLLSLCLLLFPDVHRGWLLFAAAGWVLLMAWPAASMNVRLRGRARRR